MRVVIDGREVEAREGETILAVARRAGINIPTLCHAEGVFRGATCRVCVVELENGRLVPACAFPVSDGLKVRTDTERVRRARRVVLELILAAHRISCWSCTRKGGWCVLLPLCSEYGVEGIPVCCECPLYGEECLVARGEVCLGPLAVAGCGAECPAEGVPCMACRGLVTRSDVVLGAADFYRDNGIPLRRVVEALQVFNSASRAYRVVLSALGGG